ncbi:GspE/PulE family protein [Xanthocytophaga agilis]|uniref:GspE/PulE family protein n=1 Tax=Xanthocytophaga agilis TaxID=3048010 RepID=A0AAE3R5L1_9BACT|nr:GspE/PulE family protein [Xanthocytophaga agilis]MDJ1501248.1 GspE/PulE family protein [Xanthocytophaga agilis]
MHESVDKRAGDSGVFLKVPAEMMQVLSAAQVWHYRILPKELQGSTLYIYADESRFDSSTEEELEMVLGQSIKAECVETSLIEEALQRYFPTTQVSDAKQSRGSSAITSKPDTEGEAFLMQLIREAKSLRSSDIHIESYQQRARIRIRIDGMLVERYQLEKHEYPALINQIKIMSNLDIAEKRLPQDGRIFYHQGEDRFDIRVSVLPTLHGEKVVMRILSQDATRIDIQVLGFEPQDLRRYLEGIRRPTGMMLISGPTGSGKTTTLYATLKLLNKESRNILTIEDPIEYTLEGINQVQLKENIGLGFAAALRTFLRQDPDVIMVGEIRDTDTANMAIRAALTGHLVLSTIHTNSAWGTVSRLIDMGVPPFLVANTLHTSVAQRLVRLLCPDCKQKESFEESMYPPGFVTNKHITHHFIPTGCSRCHQTGFKGRKAIYEVIPMDHELATYVKEGKMNADDLLSNKQVKTLAENAFSLFETGQTSLEEIYPLLLNY